MMTYMERVPSVVTVVMVLFGVALVVNMARLAFTLESAIGQFTAAGLAILIALVLCQMFRNRTQVP